MAEWVEAINDGNNRRLFERFARDAADARRRCMKSRDTRSDSERWAADFAAATEQRKVQQLQAAVWAQKRRVAQA